MKMQALKCPNCSGNINVEKGKEYCFCTYCGVQIEINQDNKKEYTRNININKNIHYTETDEARIAEAYYKDKEKIRKAKENKRSEILDFIIILVLIAVVLGMGKSEKDAKIGKITIGSHKDYEGENYKSVEAQIKAAGFADVELVDLDESGLFKKKGNVKTISIGGNSKFGKDDYFDPSEKVVISYY